MCAIFPSLPIYRLLLLGLLFRLASGNVDEHLLEGGLADAVIVDAEVSLRTFDLLEDHPEGEPLLGEGVLEHLAVLLLQHRARQLLGDKVLHLLADSRLDFELEAVALAELVLEVLDGAEAVELPAHHDADTCAKRLALLHRVGGERHALVVRRVLDGVPHLAARDGVHAGRRLVEENDLRAADEGDGERELALRAPAVPVGGVIAVLHHARQLHQLVRSLVELLGRDALQPAEHAQVLSSRQTVEERVELRAIPDERLRRLEVLRDGVSRDVRVPRGHRDVVRQHGQRRRLARAVDAKEPEALALGHRQVEVVDRDLLRGLARLGEDLGQVGQQDLDVWRDRALLHDRLDQLALGEDVRVGRRHLADAALGLLGVCLLGYGAVLPVLVLDAPETVDKRFAARVGDGEEAGVHAQNNQEEDCTFHKHPADVAAHGVPLPPGPHLLLALDLIEQVHRGELHQPLAKAERREDAVEVLQLGVGGLGGLDKVQNVVDDNEGEPEEDHDARNRKLTAGRRREPVRKDVCQAHRGEAVEDEQTRRREEPLDSADKVFVVESREDDHRKHADDEEHDHVPREVGEPVRVGVDATGELQVLRLGGTLFDQEHDKVRGDEAVGDQQHQRREHTHDFLDVLLLRFGHRERMCGQVIVGRVARVVVRTCSHYLPKFVLGHQRVEHREGVMDSGIEVEREPWRKLVPLYRFHFLVEDQGKVPVVVRMVSDVLEQELVKIVIIFVIGVDACCGLALHPVFTR